jgi:hypothetical protein
MPDSRSEKNPFKTFWKGLQNPEDCRRGGHLIQNNFVLIDKQF